MKNLLGEEISEWKNLKEYLSHITGGCKKVITEDSILIVCNDGYVVDINDIEASMCALEDRKDF